MAYKNPKDHLAQQRRKRVSNLAKGICPRCVRPLLPGHKLCSYHIQKAAEANRNSPKTKRQQWGKTTRTRLREASFSHYGYACACCKEARKEFLTVDHINGNGAEHRRQGTHGGTSIHRWLKRNNYPSGFRILCFNCNGAMGIYGQCPHGTLPPQSTGHPANPYKVVDKG